MDPFSHHIRHFAGVRVTFRRGMMALGIAALGYALPAAAQTTYTWNDKGGNWGKSANWTPKAVPTATDTANFQGASGDTPIIEANHSINSIVFASTAGSYTLSNTSTSLAATLSIGGGGITNNSAAAQQITGSGLSLSLLASTTFAVTGAGNLTISSTGGALNLGTQSLTLSATSTGTGTISSAVSGSGSLTKSAAGTWTLSGANTYSGNTTVSAGTLIAANATALGSSSAATSVSSGAALGISGGVALTSGSGSVAGISAVGTGVNGSGALYNVSGTNSYSGNVTLLGDTTIGAAGGTLTLSGNVTLGSAAPATATVTFNPAAGAGVTVSGVITDYASAYALNLAHTGAGVVTLSNTNVYYGNTTIGTAGGTTSGTLRMGANGALPVRNTGSLITIYSGTLDLNNFNATAQGSIALGGGGAGSTASITTGTGTLTLNHDLTFNAANNANGATVAGQIALASGTHQFTVGDSTNAAADLTVSAAIADGSGSAEIDKYGSGTLVLSGNNTYTNLTTVQQGVLSIQNNNALGSTSSGSTVSAGATLQVNGNLTVAEGLTLAGTGYGGNGALESATGNSTWTGGITLNNTTARVQADSGSTLTISTKNIAATGNGTLEVGGAGTVNVASAIVSGASGNIVAVNKKDAGTLILAGSNTFAGPIDVQGGTLSVQNNYGLGTTTTTATVESGASLAFDSTAHGNLNTASGITTINVNGTGVNGAGALTNTAGANTYNGAVNVASASTLTANAGTTLTLGGNVTGATGTTLTVGTATQNGSVTIGGAVNGVNLTKNGTVSGSDGVLTVSGGGTIGTVALNQGKMTVQSQTLNTGNFTAASGSSLLIAAGGTVNVNGNAVFNSATLDGSAGTLQVSGQHSLTFNGTISASNLTLTLAGGSIGTNAAPVTVYLGGANVTVGSIVITGDTILDFGNSAGTVLSAGALTLANANAKVQVVNWVTSANNALASTIWYATSTVDNTSLGATNQTPATNSGLGQISFVNPVGSTGNTTTWVADTSTGWFDHEIRPTPEPSTYGVIFLSGCLGLLGFRRYRQRKLAA